MSTSLSTSLVDPIGLVSDLFSEAKSTAKTVINNAATVAPYAAPLLLL